MGDPVKNSSLKEGTNGEGMDLKDLRNANTADAAGIHHFLDLVEPSRKPLECSGQSIEKPPSGGDSKSGDELKDGVRSSNTIMGLCEDDFGVIAVESSKTENALKVVQVGSHNIVMVGSGSEPIFNHLKECITRLSLESAMASTMEDAVSCLEELTAMCVKDTMKSNPNVTDHEVYYIVVGKMNKKFEMYTISNSDDDRGRVISKRVMTRIVNGGSGDKLLSTYQNNKPLDDKWIEDYEAAEYCFKCMKHALTEDNVHGGGGDINMVVINDDGYKPITFRKSDVYGYCLEP